ncbi:MAG: ATPase [Flavobacteriales bacterium]|nr:ATPase [Flavobacteriales bacterium]
MIERRLKQSALTISIISILAVFYDFGFNQNGIAQIGLKWLYAFTLLIGIVSTAIRYSKKSNRPLFKVLIFDTISVLLFIILIIDQFKILKGVGFLDSFDSTPWYYIAIFLVFIRELAAKKLSLSRTYFNPAQLFIISFFGIIFLGALLLMLPNASHGGISFLNALFTSTSAVCVTGLIVVDTGSYFTLFGQCIILTLIQIGGLGIMTFASYFSYFFRGGTSYENQLMLSDMSNSSKLGEVFSTLKNILLITISIETLGAILIFGNLSELEMPSFFERTFFSFFHSISAFCNAGFSTLPNSLYTGAFRFNYGIYGVAMVLFIFGGLGFPIVFNLFKYLKYLVSKRIIPFLLGEKKENLVTPWVINLSSRITLITSLTLFIVGSIIFFFFEYNNTLAEHSGFGKVITAMFSAASPRTAGFNTVDTSALNFSTLMLIFLLMWVGASPASTGGGIKTSTFAIATLNFWSLARGKSRIEIFRREISDISVRRAFAIITLSLVIIGAGVFAITYFDSEKDLLSIAFECFSAYSTVGLSVGITSELSSPSKLVIILIMFVGRVSMLTILIALIRKEKFKNYRYSKEEILIN